MSVQSIGPYAITGKLGEGGMGVVFRARHPNLPIEVAVKVLKASALDDEALVRFRAEVLALSRVQHPGVVPVLDAGRAQDGSPYYVMPLIAGRSLDALLAAEGPFEPKRAAALVAKLAQAVHAAHVNAAVVHRDLKPSNVLVEDATGEPKLFDFGVAKTGEGTGPRTETGVVVGTPEYMSPEQASGENALVDARTDVYGLGAVLYAVVTGKPPFERKGRPAALLIADVCLKDPVPAGSLRKGLPRDLVAVCEQAMAKERERRYSSALEMAHDLERFGRGEHVLARPPGVGAKVGRFVARHRAGVGVASTLVVVALGIATEEALRAARKSAELAKESARLEQKSGELAAANDRLAIAKLLHDARALAEGGAFLSSSVAVGPAGERGLEVQAKLRDACSAARADGERERAYPAVVEAIGLLIRARCFDDARDEVDRAEREFPDRVELLELEHHLLRTSHRPCAPLHEKAHAAAGRKPIRTSFLVALDAESAFEAHDFDRVDLLVHEADPREPLAEIVRGALAIHRVPFSFPVAMSSLTNALVAYPDDSDITAQRAFCLLQQFAARDADADAERALLRDPHHHDALGVRADVALMRCQWKESQRFLRAWIDDAPQDPLAWAYLARACALAGDDDAALEAADRAFALPLDEAQAALALASRGAVLIHRGRSLEAAKALGECLALAHDSKVPIPCAWANANVALLLVQSGQVEPARRELDASERRLSSDSTADPFVRMVLAHAWDLLGDRSKAARLSSRVREIYRAGDIPIPRPLVGILADLERVPR